MPDNDVYNEKELLLRIAEGDEKAFRELFWIYVPFLLPTVRKLVNNTQVADDIIQEVFMRIWLYRDKLIKVEVPRSWVLKIAYNRVFSYKAKYEKYVSGLDDLANLQTDVSKETEEQLAYLNLKRLVTEAIQKLPSQQRRIYQLTRDNGMSLQEVADSLQLSLQTVKNTLGKALQSIRKHIEDSGYPIACIFLFFIFF